MTTVPAIYYVSPRLRGAMLEEHADALSTLTEIIIRQRVTLPAPIGAQKPPVHLFDRV